MKNNIPLKKSFFKYQLNRVYRKITRKAWDNNLKSKNFGNRTILSSTLGNSFILDSISSNKPFAITRYGSVELNTIMAGVTDKIGLTKNAIEKAVKRRILTNNAGVFPNTAEIHKRYSELMINLSPLADGLAIWNFESEKFIINNFTDKSVCLIAHQALETWYCDSNYWTKALEGKKVLVIHPFAETIEKQYRKRELIFPEKQYLPEFELHTLKAVQTAAGEKDERFADWFEALDYMYNEALKIDFDVAILGCGAYGFPLSVMLKKAGKQAIHMGGATQILFGIKGARWDNHPVISKLNNEHWVRPSDNETPKKAENVEGGCYW